MTRKIVSGAPQQVLATCRTWFSSSSSSLSSFGGVGGVKKLKKDSAGCVLRTRRVRLVPRKRPSQRTIMVNAKNMVGEAL